MLNPCTNQWSRSTHVIESVFIDIPKHGDDVTSTEGQLSLSGERDTERDIRGRPFKQ